MVCSKIGLSDNFGNNKGGKFMDLLSLLTSSMTSQSSVNSLSQNTGVSSSAITKLLISAIPMLIKQLSSNASSAEGAQSLLGALGQHTSTASIESQIANADAVDGSKILSHILGGDSAGILNSLSGQTGLNESQVSSVLSNITPAMMSSLSATTTAASKATKNQQKGIDFSDGLDMDELAQLFGSGAATSSSKSAASAMDMEDLLGSFLGMGGSSSKKSSSGGSIIDSLMGGGTTSKSSKKSDSSDLLKSLLKMMY